MNLSRMHSLFALSLAGSLAMAGCSGDDIKTNNNTNNNTKQDAGVADTGVPPADAGVADTGPVDTGVVIPPPPCPPGTEGCACTSNIGPDDMAFLADDCVEASNLCVPFDLISGRQDLTGALQSCVRTCATDVDCGSGQTCAATGYGDETGAAFICMDRIAGFDEYCGYSRGLISRVPDISLETSGEIVGCEVGSECLVGVFSDSHPDEGICLSFCQGDDECAGETPYCNPKVFTSNSTTTPFIGVCSTGRFDAGSLCGADTPDKVGITARCDTSDGAVPNTVCVGLGGLFDEGKGLCMTTCNATDTCQDDANLGPQTCVPEFFNNGDGVCSNGCTNSPETCSATGGSEDLGTVCFEMETYFDLGDDEVHMCLSRLGPPLTAATVDSSGNIPDQGGNCVQQGGSNDFLRCPYPSHCAAQSATEGLCVTGCKTAADSAPACSDLLGSTTATCAAVFVNDPTTGICGDN